MMKIFSAQQVKDWDAFTIAHEPVTAVDLMERAASACVDWLKQRFPALKKMIIFCGTGNNGGDGLAIARLLQESGYSCKVYITGDAAKASEAFTQNLERLKQSGVDFAEILTGAVLPVIKKDEIVIDAIFGAGLNRAPEGLQKDIIERINQSSAEVVAIDVPSGMMIDKSSKGNTIVTAKYTLSFQSMKLCLLMPENAGFFGEVCILPIGLDECFENDTPTTFSLVAKETVAALLPPRKPFSHKGSYGHALLIAGSEGKMGAAVMAAKACLRSGAGLLTVTIPGTFFPVIHTVVPEAMVAASEKIQEIHFAAKKYSCVGIGPGMGTDESATKMLRYILYNAKDIPFLLDADALTILSRHKDWLKQLPQYCIVTPHPKEFDRLFGDCANDFERAEKAVAASTEHNLLIILKGHYTLIAHKGKGLYIQAGNAGMAKGGSGDVLTGIITALAGQMDPESAAIAGIYLHGTAANLSLQQQSMESMLATDIIDHLGKAFDELRGVS